MGIPSPPCNHYEVLGLSRSLPTLKITTQDIKKAYRRSLLQHHPDKIDTLISPHISPLSPSAQAAKYTIDDISLAYKILTNPRDRAEYDRILRLQQQAPTSKGTGSIAQTGLETVDLDDLQCDEVQDIWYRGCRCGDERGFRVTEEELEKEKEHGEVVTGCRGCSLWLKILFQIAENDEVDQKST
ncbi:hypothetical protein MMC16_007213 [Acarospora aff. strigata]|nr:hypothetical protein [Acarospora aff. strigata]